MALPPFGTSVPVPVDRPGSQALAAVRPRLAAAVALVRPGAHGLEVFWVRRGERLRFAGGFYAFPGGAVEPSDAEGLRGFPEAGPHGAGSAGAALRELFEETGVLALPGGQRIPKAARDAARKALLSREPKPDPKVFARLLEAHGVALDPSLLQPAGRWVTPDYFPIRFDALFFVAELPEGEVAEVWPGELVEGQWIRPADALSQWEAGRALLHPPGLHTLRALALGSVDRALPLLREPHRAPWRISAPPGSEPEWMEFQRGLVLVPLRTPTLPPATHTNCLLLGDRELWVVDPGSPYPEEQARLDRTLDELSAEGRHAVGILLTHEHHDHVAGAQLLAAQRGLPIATTRATLAKLPELRITRVLADGELLEVGPRGWRCLQLPGHTQGHLCLLEEGSGAVVAGDLVAGIGTVVINPPEGDMSDYLQSLDRLLSLGPGVVYPAHGPVVTAGESRLREYKAHRLAREAKVLAALRAASGPALPKELVPAAYDDVAPELHGLAERSLIAHLLKLVKDGAATVRGERYAAR